MEKQTKRQDKADCKRTIYPIVGGANASEKGSSYYMPNASFVVPEEESEKNNSTTIAETGAEIWKTFAIDNEKEVVRIDGQSSSSRFPDSPAMGRPRDSRSRRRVTIERLARERKRGTPPKIPSVVYVKMEPLPELSIVAPDETRDPAATDAIMLESEAVDGLDFDASTISASPSAHVLLKSIVKVALEVPIECPREESERNNSETETNGGCRHEPSQLNPNAPTFVPSRPPKKRSSPCRSLTRVFCRSTTAYQQLAEVSSQVDVPVTTRTLSPRPPAVFSKPFPLLPKMARISPKITVVNEKLKIFVVDLLSEEECNWILHFTEQHVANALVLGRETWRKIFTHTQLDLPCCEVLPLRCLIDRLMMYIRQIVGKMYNARRAASRLVPRSWKEPHLLRYQKIPGQLEHSGMIMHHDGGYLTWQVMLSSYGVDYNGGGTYFRCLRQTVILRKGQMLVHPGNLYHRGVNITSGMRTLMVCFMDGFDLGVKDLSNDEDSILFERNVIHV